jgi:hypothetical protein
MYAIPVKFLGATATKGSRLKATLRPRVTIEMSVDHSLNWHQMAEKVARVGMRREGNAWADKPLNVWDSPCGGWVVVPKL